MAMWGFMEISVMELQMNLIAETKQKEHWKISILFLNLTHGIVSQRKATEESDSLCHLNPQPSIIQARPHTFHPYPSVTVPPIVDLHNRVILLRGTLLMIFQGSKSHFFACVYYVLTYMFVGMHVGVQEHLFRSVWKPEILLQCILQSSSPLLIEVKSLAELRNHQIQVLQLVTLSSSTQKF